ncbi:glycosyltransferase [Caldisericum sp.]|uniref:glycosyltransferase n=1 Tax=Caldisericum sp. TaxID=2499687 RepID=UPI003D0C3D06
MENIKFYFGIFGYLFVGVVLFLILLGKSSKKVPIRRKYSVNKFIAIIPAHNEENVIANSILSVKKAGFDKVVVILDKCTDDTPIIAKGLGAEAMFVNFRSKGRSLAYAIPQIVQKYGEDAFYMIFDADNVVEEKYIEHIKPYVESYPVIQTNLYNLNVEGIIPRMYIFMDAIYLRIQKALTLLGLSSIISGYGWGAYGWVFNKHKFNCNSVLEDFEYTVKLPLKVTFVEDATVFDEKPVNFIASFRQRLRWYRGYFYTVFKVNGIAKNLYTIPLIVFSGTGILSFLLSLPNPLYISIPVVVFVLHTLFFLLPLNERELKDVKWYDIFLIFFFNMTNLAAILTAMFTYNKTEWIRTPHVFKVNI